MTKFRECQSQLLLQYTTCATIHHKLTNIRPLSFREFVVEFKNKRRRCDILFIESYKDDYCRFRRECA